MSNMLLAAALSDVVQILCVHLVVVSEREICAVLLCVVVFCITLTRSGAGPNGCVSKLQVQVQRVIHICVVYSRFTHGVAVFVWGMLCCRCAWWFDVRCVHSFARRVSTLRDGSDCAPAHTTRRTD